MANDRMTRVFGRLRRVALVQEYGGLTDGQLLERFLARREEEAFAALVRRHGPMVLGVCRQILRNTHDAEDAFQATFLVLARKASSVVPRDLIGHWLHGVARRTAMKARTAAARRLRTERMARTPSERIGPADDDAGELRSLLDEELRRLPDKYVAPLVLCFLEGKTRKEVARQLGWSEGTLSGRLARAKALLAARLARRGFPVSLGALAFLLEGTAATASVPFPLASATVTAALFVAAGRQAAGAASASILALTEEVLKTMLLTKLKVATAVVLAVGMVLGAGMIASQPRAAAEGEPLPWADGKARLVQSPARQPKPARPPYRIGPTDILQVETVPEGGKFQPVRGQNLVRPDGTISLGIHGSVYVADLTLEEARQAVARKLNEPGKGVDGKAQHVELDVLAYNSKVYYLIVEDKQAGDQVLPMPMTGSDTVLDALGYLKDLTPMTAVQEIRLVRQDKTLPVDWVGLAWRADTATNYELLSGDRIIVKVKVRPRKPPEEVGYLRKSGEEDPQAEKDFRTADFYRRTGRLAATRFFYELIRRRYADTPYRDKAENRLRELREDSERKPEHRRESRAKVGRILIVGNDRTPDEVLLWAFPLSPGEEFAEADLRRAEDVLNRLSRSMTDPRKRFRATVTVVEPGPADTASDILITVKE